MTYQLDGLRILVVDDNFYMRTLLCRILQAFGIKTIHEASSAEEAWQTLTLNRCDIVLLDWVLEGMSGVEFTRNIRNAPNSPNPLIPIIMISGYSSLDCVDTAREAGVTEFLAKPVSIKGILDRLVAIIEHPRGYVRIEGFFGPCGHRHQIEPWAGRAT